MEVYIEYVILDNFSVDLLLLLLTCRIMRFPIVKWRIALSGLVGTVFALLSPCLKLSGAVLFPIKTAMGLAVYWIGCGRKRKNLSGLTVFFAVTFLFGGVCLGVFELFQVSFYEGTELRYGGIPIGFVIVPILLAWSACERLTRLIRKKRDVSPFIRTVRVTYRGRECDLRAFVDSGNRLYRNSDPVCVIDYRGVSLLLGSDVIGLFAGGRGCDYITLQSFNGKQTRLLSFYADKLDILDRDEPKSWTCVCFAVVMKDFGDVEPYDVLLNPALI